jgi:RHS repeat-associated protein
MAFHGLPVRAARDLLTRDFGSVLAGASANPAASIARAGRIVRFVGDDRAVVRTARGFEEKISSAPLLVSGAGGVKRPVDLGLVTDGRAFMPASPLTAVSIAHDSGGGVAVGSSGLRMTLEGGASVPGSVIHGQSVFFGGVAPDMDAAVAPALGGVELFAVLRSRLSPEQLRYRLSLPVGAVLRGAASGAVVLRAGKVLAQIPAPTAYDAQGVIVPVQMGVVGDELLLDVRHHTSDVAYPVLVDPALITITNSSEGWTFKSNGFEGFTHSLGSGASVSVNVTTNYGYEKTAELEYVKAASQPTVKQVEFQGLSFSGSSTNEKGEPVNAVKWGILVCHYGYGSHSAPPTTLVFEAYEVAYCMKDPFSIQFELTVEASGFAASGTISTSAIVLTTEWARDEGYQAEEYGAENKGQPFKKHCAVGDPVNCATGNLTESQTDLTVGGRGPVLGLTRNYNSQLAASESEHGIFGYGWTGSYSAHLALAKTCETCSETATVYQDNGSVTLFEKSGEQWEPVAPLVQATLKKEGTGYIYTLPDQTKLAFSSSGQLTSETDRNGNALTLAYNSKNQLETVTDGAGRELTFSYNSEGEVKSVEDPVGYTVEYTYEGGNLKSVTQLDYAALRWQFKYNGSHEMTEMTDGRSNTTTTEYNGSHQVIAQTDPLKRKRTWKYGTIAEGTYTEVTEPNGAVTRHEFNEQGLPTSVTRAYGTSLAATTTFEYEGLDNLVSVTDPNKHTTKYTYDAAGDRTSETDPDGDETKWGYDSTHDVTSITTPDGETTTIKRNSAGDPEVIERPAPGSSTQKTTYKYDSYGDVESMTNPLEHTWKYGYDSYGDRTSETDPEGNKRTWEFDADSQEIATVSPRGNVTGGEPARFTTRIEPEAQGRPMTIREPLESFGSAGSAAGQLNFPSGEAIDAHGNVWVADTGNNRVEEFSESGSFIKTVGFGVSNGEEKLEICTSSCRAGIAGSGSGQFREPVGVAFYSGTLYVADQANSRVEELNEKGEYTGGFGYFGYPSGIAVSPGGDIWATDIVGERVEEFSSTGTLMEVIGYGVSNGEDKFQICTTTCRPGIGGSKNGQFEDPRYLTFDGTSMYVSESGNSRVQEFNEKAEYVTKFGTKGSSKTEFKAPMGIAANPSTGNLYIVDSGNHRVKEVTSAGEFVQEYRGALNEPIGVAVNSLGAVYVVDTGNDRVADWTLTTPRVTKYTYDGDGNVESITDPNGHTAKYTYDADNERTKVEEPNKTVTEAEYDSMGQVKSQTDGNKHVTKYVRNALEEVEEEVNSLGKKTLKEYDAAGNLVKLTDPKGRTTTYTYDPANRLTEVSYSSGTPSTIKYEYNKDGDRTKMTDGTGTTKYEYDQLDRMTESENGHKEIVKYEYNLGNQQTKITYPNTKAIERAYDKDGRLEKITDWSANVTKFTYNPDSELATIVFPSATKDEDTYAYDNTDQMSETKMLKGTETLASLVYTRDNDGQATSVTSKGLPGEEKPSYEYDTNNRLTKGAGTSYEYDAANNPTKIGAGTYKYNEADQLETGPSLTYTYDELGERTKTKPSTGPATTYGYDQASNLISIERPKEGETSEIKDTYAYNGEGLRVSQTISGTTSYLVWDMVEELPLILSDGTNSYIYGPGGLPVEQINNTTGTIQYLHHDQAGSTRLITGSTGKTEATFTYGPYGETTGSTGTATTPLGYDGQYTSSDTGLIYLRNRVYDPKTAQFLTVDPLVSISGAPYNYAGDNPLTYGDAVGLLWTPLAGGAGGADAACGATIEIPGVDIGTCGAAGIATGAAAVGAAIGVVTAVAGSEGGDEGEAELKKKEAERESCGNPASPPGSKFEWKGKGPVGSSEGSWWDPDADESLYPHLGENSHGPHYDYEGPSGNYRIYPDGRIEAKP